MARSAALPQKVVIDASVMLAFYLPAEPYKAQAISLAGATAAGHVSLCAPTLLRYEVLNALSRAVRGVKKGQRISLQDAGRILDGISALQVEEHGIEGLESRILAIAKDYHCSAYDASYLALAEHLRTDFLTGDQAFHRALSDRAPRVKFLGEYTPPGG